MTKRIENDLNNKNLDNLGKEPIGKLGKQIDRRAKFSTTTTKKLPAKKELNSRKLIDTISNEIKINERDKSQLASININLNTADQLSDKINKLTINDTLQLKNLADKLTQIESRKNFSIFNYISSDNLVSLIYSLSVSQLFYIAVMQPQRLRNSYGKWLNRCTGNRLLLLNRDIIDFFGVASSVGMVHYEPVLDFNFTTRKFKELVQVWTI